MDLTSAYLKSSAAFAVSQVQVQVYEGLTKTYKVK